MKWLVFSYSLPSKLRTASRVRIWRKLRKSGAVSPKAGVHILPYTDECVEATRWLATEVEQESGEAIVMQVNQFENMTHDKVIDIFRKERLADYHEIESFITKLEQAVEAGQAQQGVASEPGVSIRRDIGKLKKNIDEVARLDFFPAYDKRNLLDRLHKLQKTLVTGNLLLLLCFSFGTLNTMVLHKMTDEQTDVSQKEDIKEDFKVKRFQLKTVQSL